MNILYNILTVNNKSIYVDWPTSEIKEIVRSMISEELVLKTEGRVTWMFFKGF